MVEDVVDLDRRWNMKYPNGPNICGGDLSMENDAYTPFNKGHRNGRIVEFRPARNDGNVGGLTLDSPV